MSANQIPEFRNRAREDDDGKSLILAIHSNNKWRYDYVIPGCAQNPTRYWRIPSAKKIVSHLLICGGSVRFMTATICDGIRPDMHQVLVAIYRELEKEENAEFKEEWERLVELSEKASLRLGDDELLNNYQIGESVNAPAIKEKRQGKGKDGPKGAEQPAQPPRSATLDDLLSHGAED